MTGKKRDDLWRTEEADLVKTLWNQGHSASQIAMTMNRTRNAIIGRISRMRVTDDTLRSKPMPRLTGEERRERVKRSAEANRVAGVRRRAALLARCAAAEAAEKPKEEGYTVAVVQEPMFPTFISFDELTDVTCRWPYGDGPFLYCGAPVANIIENRPYCPEHTKLGNREL